MRKTKHDGLKWNEIEGAGNPKLNVHVCGSGSQEAKRENMHFGKCLIGCFNPDLMSCVNIR